MPDGNAFTFYFQHGWALNSLFWMPLKQDLKKIYSKGCNSNILDRGYFCEYPDVNVKDSTNARVVICHSLGLHLLPKVLLDADFFVLMGFFETFHPEDKVLNIRSQKIIRRMLLKLLDDSESVIFVFHNLCFNSTADQTSHNLSKSIINEFDIWNIDLLRRDLFMLQNNFFDLSDLNPKAGVLILQGEKDMVVPEEKAYELSKKIQGSKLEFIKGGSHGFALQSPGEVAKSIENFLSTSGKNTIIRNSVLNTTTSPLR